MHEPERGANTVVRQGGDPTDAIRGARANIRTDRLDEQDLRQSLGDERSPQPSIADLCLQERQRPRDGSGARRGPVDPKERGQGFENERGLAIGESAAPAHHYGFSAIAQPHDVLTRRFIERHAIDRLHLGIARHRVGRVAKQEHIAFLQRLRRGVR